MMYGARIPLIAAIAGALLLAGCGNDNGSPVASTRTFSVTIENLTTGQPFSPGVIVTHESSVVFWRSGQAASEGLREIAENGNPDVAVSELSATSGVSDVTVIGAPTHRQGGPGASSATFEVAAGPGVTRLSMAVMLICTNDGFTGLDSIVLPTGVDPFVFETGAWDAGTEVNDELYTSIVDPCGAIGPDPQPADGSNARTATSSVVMPHGGIQGVGDLSPALHGWSDPVARITIRRLT